MRSRIPSWVVAVVGAAIAIVATATSATLLHQTRTNLKDAWSEIGDTRREVDLLWSSHRQADQRSATADVFFAQALAESPSRSFLLEQTAFQLRGAVLSMWAASGEPVPDETPAAITADESKLRKGDARGYASLKSEIDRLRLLSQSHLDGLSARNRAAESRIESLQAHGASLYLAYVFFNLLGLMVTMCKDLPVWRVERREEGEA